MSSLSVRAVLSLPSPALSLSPTTHFSNRLHLSQRSPPHHGLQHLPHSAGSPNGDPSQDSKTLFIITLHHLRRQEGLQDHLPRLTHLQLHLPRNHGALVVPNLLLFSPHSLRAKRGASPPPHRPLRQFDSSSRLSSRAEVAAAARGSASISVDSTDPLDSPSSPLVSREAVGVGTAGRRY